MTIEQELIPAARARGHVCDRINLGSIRLDLFSELCATHKLESYDLVYFRTTFGEVTSYPLAELLSQTQVRIVNGIYGARPFVLHKMYQIIQAGLAGVPVPRTVVSSSLDFDLISQNVGLPFVAKADVSSQGRDVYLVTGQEDFNRIVQGEEKNQSFLFQEFIEHAYDVRVHLVGHEPVAAYRRFPAAGEFRSNVSLGGRMAPVEEVERFAVYSLARKANAAFGLDIGAIDFLHNSENNEYVFAEINSNPGWELADREATGVDMTSLVIDYFERITHH